MLLALMNTQGLQGGVGSCLSPVLLSHPVLNSPSGPAWFKDGHRCSSSQGPGSLGFAWGKLVGAAPGSSATQWGMLAVTGHSAALCVARALLNAVLCKTRLGR